MVTHHESPMSTSVNPEMSHIHRVSLFILACGRLCVMASCEVKQPDYFCIRLLPVI
jgi:hypothetical protein